MYRFVFLAVFFAMVAPNLAVGVRGFTLDALPSARSFDFKELCKWFCEDQDKDYDYDYIFRTLDHVVHPRIFCGICEKKYTTRTPKPSSSTTTSTTTAKTTTSSSTPSTTATPTTPTTTKGPPTPLTTMSSPKPANGTKNSTDLLS